MTNKASYGILLMIASTFVFALQDSISKHLASEYNVYMVVMVRYWFFALFVITWATLKTGSIVKVAATSQLWLQIIRGILLVLEICVMILGFVYVGLVEGLAIFIAYPLVITALSGPILGEFVGWRRWVAISVGFIGMLIILQPGRAVFSPYAILPLCSCLMFALYGLLTRYVARKDSAITSFFWTGIVGAVVITCIGLFFWEEMSNEDWGWMILLCVLGTLGHFFLIKCYELSEASVVQPFAYFHLIFGISLGLLIFEEDLKTTTAIGVIIVISAGLFTLWREQQKD